MVVYTYECCFSLALVQVKAAYSIGAWSVQLLSRASESFICSEHIKRYSEHHTQSYRSLGTVLGVAKHRNTSLFSMYLVLCLPYHTAVNSGTLHSCIQTSRHLFIYLYNKYILITYKIPDITGKMMSKVDSIYPHGAYSLVEDRDFNQISKICYY